MTITKKSIDIATAERAVDAAAKKSAELGFKMCIAITDESGDLKAFRRMDGAPKLSIQIAEDKAYTAASFGLPTHVWYDFIKNDPPLLHGISFKKKPAGSRARPGGRGPRSPALDPAAGSA